MQTAANLTLTPRDGTVAAVADLTGVSRKGHYLAGLVTDSAPSSVAADGGVFFAHAGVKQDIR
jgi:hypothetical protein